MDIPKLKGVPKITLDHYEQAFADRHLLHGVVAKWAKETPTPSRSRTPTPGRR